MCICEGSIHVDFQSLDGRKCFILWLKLCIEQGSSAHTWMTKNSPHKNWYELRVKLISLDKQRILLFQGLMGKVQTSIPSCAHPGCLEGRRHRADQDTGRIAGPDLRCIHQMSSSPSFSPVNSSWGKTGIYGAASGGAETSADSSVQRKQRSGSELILSSVNFSPCCVKMSLLHRKL